LAAHFTDLQLKMASKSQRSCQNSNKLILQTVATIKGYTYMIA
jgi:hypothetical protein